MTTAVTTTDSYTREKIDLIKNTVAKGATDLELQLFFHACQRTGLDPLMKQIYAIKRWNSVDKRETLTFQTGIDGYRLIADRTGCYAGSSDAEYELDGEGYPGVARVTVTKLVNGMPCQFAASARWTEYVQRTRDGEPNSMWKKMPFLMLAKCAEALALRKAFPAELSGVYTHEEMMQADTEPKSPKQVDAPPPPVDPGETSSPVDAEKRIDSAEAASSRDALLSQYRRTLATCDPTIKAVNAWWATVPTEMRDELNPDFMDALKAVSKKR